MDYFVNHKDNILKVVKDYFSCIRTWGNQMKDLSDSIDNLFHQYEILIIGDNQKYLQFIDQFEQYCIRFQSENLC